MLKSKVRNHIDPRHCLRDVVHLDLLVQLRTDSGRRAIDLNVFAALRQNLDMIFRIPNVVSAELIYELVQLECVESLPWRKIFIITRVNIFLLLFLLIFY